MATVKFQEVSVGAEFTLDGLKYKKIEPEKVSCCRSVMASQADSPDVKITVSAEQEVTVDEQ
jgi:hypothetical protein